MQAQCFEALMVLSEKVGNVQAIALP